MENKYEDIEEVKGGSHQVDSNLLAGSKIPSLGCFLVLLSFMGSRKEIKQLLKGLKKQKGLQYFNDHI